jgi:hypothetical protein
MGQKTGFPIETIKGSEITPLDSVSDTMTTTVTKNGETRKATHTQIKNDIEGQTRNNLILSGAGAPGSTPSFIGQMYIDTTGKRQYFATGTASSADWRKVARHDYGTITVTGGGGDVTVNLDFDWSDGIAIISVSDTASDYLSDTADVVSTYRWETTYDALTNAGYTANQNHLLFDQNTNQVQSKTFNQTGTPKSATTSGITIDDGGTTGYVKYTVIA